MTEEKHHYTVTINDGFTSETYHFESNGKYSIEFLAGVFAGIIHDKVEK